jgi:hypothetical protein
LGSTAAAFLLLGIFFGLIFPYIFIKYLQNILSQVKFPTPHFTSFYHGFQYSNHPMCRHLFVHHALAANRALTRARVRSHGTVQLHHTAIPGNLGPREKKTDFPDGALEFAQYTV